MHERPGPAILARADQIYKHALADPRAAREPAASLVAAARAAGDVPALVAALRAEAWALRGTAFLPEARQRLDEAARLATRHQTPGRLPQILISRAAVLAELGLARAAHRDLLRAEGLDPVRNLGTALLRATLLANIGRADDAIRLLRLVVLEGTLDLDSRVKALNNLAYLEAQQGNLALATDAIDAALLEAPHAGAFMEAVVTQTSAWIHVQAGRFSTGLDQFAVAGELYVKAGLPLGEHFIEYADALADLRLLPEALAAAERAETELIATPLMRAEAQVRVARLLLLTGAPAQAREAASAAAVELRAQGRTGWVARAVALAHRSQLGIEGTLSPAQVRSLRGCARTLSSHGMRVDAIDAGLALGRLPGPRCRDDLREVVRLSARGSALVRLKGRIAAALLARAEDRPSDVLRHCRAGLGDLTRHRDGFGSLELRALASGHGVELGELALAALLPKGRPAPALRWMERTRAAAVVSTTPITAGESGLVARLRSLEASAGAIEGPERHRLELSIRELEQQIRRSSWRKGERTGPEDVGAVVSLVELRELLGAAVLVEYAVLDGTVHAATLGGDRPARLVELGPLEPLVRQGDALLFALRRMGRPGSSIGPLHAARTSAVVLLERLSAALVAPLGLGGDTPVVVVPVGALQRIPWAPLHSGPVTVAPSAAVWARTCMPGAPAEPRSVALVAGPGLPGAVAEVSALHALYPGARVLLPPRSTVAAVLGAIEDADLAHLACHGRIRADNALFSALTLADGPLLVHELAGGAPTPRQVVLAACDSAVQTTYPGDEALGFVSALLARGTCGLLASTVLLPDIDTVPLVRALHSNLRRGMPVAKALHRTRGALDLDSPGEFVASCAFQAYGAG